MNMFWRKSRASENDPDQVRERLVHLFRHAHVGDMFTIDDLADRIRAKRKDNLAYTLSQLTSDRQVDQVITVVSPTGGGIARFSDIDQIPEELYDPFQLKEIEVNPSLIRVFFTKHIPETVDPRHSSHSTRVVA